MYWPFGSPTVLSTPPPPVPSSSTAGGSSFDSTQEPLLGLAQNRSSSLFATLSRSIVSLWSVKPPVVLAMIQREEDSISEQGENVAAWFAWDSQVIIVLTSKSYLIAYNLIPLPSPYAFYGTTESRVAEEVFQYGAGEGGEMLGWGLQWGGSWYIEGNVQSLTPHPHTLILALSSPSLAILTLPYPIPPVLPDQLFPFSLATIPSPQPPPYSPKAHTSLTHSRPLNVHTLVLPSGQIWLLSPSSPAAPSSRMSRDSDGMRPGASRSMRESRDDGDERAYGARRLELKETSGSGGGRSRRSIGNGSTFEEEEDGNATVAALNAKFCLLAVGTESGLVHFFSLPTPPLPPVPHLDHPLSLSRSTNNFRVAPGRVTSLCWTPDGYALAVGWERGWGVWSTGGRLLGWGVLHWEDAELLAKEDSFMRGVERRGLIWAGGGLELILLSSASPPPSLKEVLFRREWKTSKPPSSQLFTLPFAKSSFTTLPTPSSTLYPLLLLSTKLLLSPTASLPSSSYLSSLTPSSSLWLPISLPHAYITVQYPIRYATVSEDGRLVAVAGRRGLTHWSKGSGRWKLFEMAEWEENFRVRGGMVWFLHVLVAGVEEGKEFSIRLFSRDDALTPTSHLSSVSLPAPVHLMSVHDNSLLVYTVANTFYHFLIVPTNDSVELKLCGSISFEGVVAMPGRVRAMSWLIPLAQKRLGHPSDDLPLATVIFLIDTSLVLLRPRKGSRGGGSAQQGHHRRNSSLAPVSGQPSEEVKYDLQILADRIESYWTHLSGIGTLENSLWGWDGEKLRVWLDALTVDRVRAGPKIGEGGRLAEKSYERVAESVSIPLDFYPLSVLMDKGIIIGIETELSIRQSLSFSTYKIQTTTHLFLPHLLKYHLSRGQIKAAVRFAAHFQNLSYFAHALEILLHGVLEQEADEGPGASPRVVESSEWNDAKLSTLSPIANSFPDTPEQEGVEKEREAGGGGGSGSGEKALRVPVGGGAGEVWRQVRRIDSGGVDEMQGVLPLVVEFLDHFPQALDVVVGCARKTEVARWGFLFDVVGPPRDLFETCLASNLLKTATSYLLVLHNLEQLDDSSTDTVRLLRAAMAAGEWNLCKDLLRFLHSVDESGTVLRDAIKELAIFEKEHVDATFAPDLPSPPLPVHQDTLPLLSNLPETPTGPPRSTPRAKKIVSPTPRRPEELSPPNFPSPEPSSSSSANPTPVKMPLYTRSNSSTSQVGLGSLLYLNRDDRNGSSSTLGREGGGGGDGEGEGGGKKGWIVDRSTLFTNSAGGGTGSNGSNRSPSRTGMVGEGSSPLAGRGGVEPEGGGGGAGASPLSKQQSGAAAGRRWV
ncbi:RIC1-domain-containing protein [Mrakia frigida]|uniref:RIC1 family protein n=1 Tax=Mrakia frigida TaxID=29902 RepID=UPI003FCC11A6